MYRAVVLVLFVITTLAEKDMKNSACNKFGPTLVHCCNNISALPPMGPESDVRECYEKTKPAPPGTSCEMEECLAKKLGYYGSDGKLDIDGFTNYVINQLEKDTEVLSVIKEKCLNADITKYGTPDMCDFQKMRICYFTFLFIEKCTWSDEGECKGIKDIMQECKME